MDEREARLGGRFLGGRGALPAILAVAFVLSLAAVDWRGGVFNTGGLSAMGEIAAAAFQPDLAPDVLAIGARSTWTTIKASSSTKNSSVPSRAQTGSVPTPVEIGTTAPPSGNGCTWTRSSPDRSDT